MFLFSLQLSLPAIYILLLIDACVYFIFLQHADVSSEHPSQFK